MEQYGVWKTDFESQVWNQNSMFCMELKPEVERGYIRFLKKNEKWLSKDFFLPHLLTPSSSAKSIYAAAPSSAAESSIRHCGRPLKVFKSSSDKTKKRKFFGSVSICHKSESDSARKTSCC